MPRRSVVALALASPMALWSPFGGCTLEFVCRDDAQCTLEGRAGSCEADGFCSFPDSSCDSGRRYHDSAARTVAGRCTTPEAVGSSGAPVDSSSSTPAEPGCGDGIVGEDEECDDGNAVDGDGCNNDCRPSGQVVWNAEYDGLDDGEDDAWGIALSPAGDVYVAGRIALGDDRTAAWVRMYDVDGNELWTRDVVHGDAGTDGALTLALRPAGGLYVGGWAATTAAAEAPDDTEDFWLARLDPDDGKVDAETIFDGNGGGDRLRGITVADNGDIVGTGWIGTSQDQPDEDLWYGRFDAQSLELVWSQVFDAGTGEGERAWRSATLPSGQLVVAGSIRRPGNARAWLRRLTAQGAEIQSVEYEEASLWLDVQGIPGSTDLMVAGTDFSGPGRAVAQRLTREGDTVWTGGWPESTPTEQDDLYALAVGPAGEFVIAGRIKLGDDDGWDAWITKFDAGGDPLWTRTHSGSAGSSDVASDVAIDQDGSVVIVGYRVSASNGRNIWVRKYTP